MSEKKTEQAMRLFEVMEGVDPKLLARSEKETKVLPFQRYAKAMKAMAACLALILVGGTCFVILQNGGGQKAKNESAMAPMSDSAQKGSGISQDMAYAEDAQHEEAWEAAEHEQNGISQGATANSAAGVEAACEADSNSNDSSMLEELTKTISSDDMPDQASGTRTQETMGNSVSRDKEQADNFYKGLLSISKIKGKSSYALRTPGRQNGMVLDLDGGEAVYVDAAKALELLTLMNDLELQPVGEQRMTEYVECGICDEDGVIAYRFRISGKYLQVVGEDEFYEILSDDFDYDKLRADAVATLQEE